MVVSQEFARKYLPNEDPLGKQIQLDIPGDPVAWRDIIGVAGDVKSFSEGDRVDPEVYEDFEQRPLASFSVMLRSQIGPNSLSSALRSIVVQIDPDLPLRRLMSMEDMIETRRNGNPLFRAPACDVLSACADPRRDRKLMD